MCDKALVVKYPTSHIVKQVVLALHQGILKCSQIIMQIGEKYKWCCYEDIRLDMQYWSSNLII